MSAPLRRVVRYGPIEGWVFPGRHPVKTEVLDCGHPGWATTGWRSRTPVFRPCAACATRYVPRPKLQLEASP